MSSMNRSWSYSGTLFEYYEISPGDILVGHAVGERGEWYAAGNTEDVLYAATRMACFGDTSGINTDRMGIEYSEERAVQEARIAIAAWYVQLDFERFEDSYFAGDIAKAKEAYKGLTAAYDRLDALLQSAGRQPITRDYAADFDVEAEFLNMKRREQIENIALHRIAERHDQSTTTPTEGEKGSITMTKVKLVQSDRFPNLWSLVHADEDMRAAFEPKSWRDGLLANGAVAAEGAVSHARENGLQIVEIVSTHWDDPGDNTKAVIAGIEYRSKRPVLDRYDYIAPNGKVCHVIEVYPSGTASILYKDTGWHDEVQFSSLVTPAEVEEAERAILGEQS